MRGLGGVPVTQAQTDQMREDTAVIVFDEKKSVIVVFPNPVPESDPRFYTDVDWLAWVGPQFEFTTDLIHVVDERVNWMVGVRS